MTDKPMNGAPRLAPPIIPGYVFVAEIATGGYSIVYRYRQLHPQRDVAVKVLTGTGPDATPDVRDAEANMMAKLGNHPNIVQVIAAGTAEDGQHYIVMPYYAGRSLAELVAKGPLDVRRVIRIGIQVGGAIDAAHRFGLLHRDIKPANILIDEFGTPRLTDFGISGWVGPDQRSDVGGWSLPWTPAEIIRGSDSSRGSDIYALGATLWQLLAGHPPYERRGDTRADLERRICDTDAPAVDRADLPAGCNELLARMLSRDPAVRPTRAADVVAELERIESALSQSPAAPTAFVPQPRVVTEPPGRPEFEATADRVRPAGSPASHVVVVPPGSDPASGFNADLTARPRTGTAGPAPSWEKTELRVPVAVDEPESETERRSSRATWVILGVALTVIAVVAGAVILSGSGKTANTPDRPSGDTSQNALDNGVPPGVPVVTAKRLNSTTIRFTWTYAAAESTDSFKWTATGGSPNGIVYTPSVDVPDRAGVQMCIEVKVYRNNGGNAATEWSPPGCGS
jgi:serine/threonine protein kinase